MKQFKILLLFLCSLIITFAVVIWDNIGVYSGVYGIDKPLDYLGTSLLLINSILLLLSLIFSFKNKKWLITGIPFFFFLINFFGFSHGKEIFISSYCDLSICYKLQLYKDGSFQLTRASQLETRIQNGTFKINNDTLELTKTLLTIRPYNSVDINFFENKNCIGIKALNFKPLFNSICK